MGADSRRGLLTQGNLLFSTLIPFSAAVPADFTVANRIDPEPGPGPGPGPGPDPGPAPIPEPATILLLGAGLVGLAGLGRKNFFRKN